MSTINALEASVLKTVKLEKKNKQLRALKSMLREMPTEDDCDLNYWYDYNPKRLLLARKYAEEVLK